MLDHVTLKVSDFKTSNSFYTGAFKPLGITGLYGDGEQFAGFGLAPKAFFWIGESDEPITGAHVAFTAPNRAAVDAFYNAAIAAGAKDNGKPGLRAHYHTHYYGAFVLDPDGHNIEAVCHHPAP
jgi:catechol 2,3-dioxygenase-like lactoylglutathione lyase family enzyme